MQIQKTKSKEIKNKSSYVLEEKNDFLIFPNLDLPGSKVIDNELKIKTLLKALSPLKTIDEVINYFKEIKKDKEKNSLPKYLSDIIIDKLDLHKCQNFNKICFIRLPIIVINQEFYNSFKNFLFDYYQYKKYKDNNILIDYLILGNNEILNYEL